MVKQITVEELFGSSLPKDPSLPTVPTQTTTTASSETSNVYMHKQSFPTPAHQNTLLPPLLVAQDPGSTQRHQTPGRLPAPYMLHPSPVFQTVVPRSDPQPLSSPLMVPPPSSEPRVAPPTSAAPSAPPAPYLGQDILNTLKPAASVTSDIQKPILAPNFLPNTLFPPHSFQDPTGGKTLLQHGNEIDVFSQPPNMVKPISVSSQGLFVHHHCSDVTVSVFYSTVDLNVIQNHYCIFSIHRLSLWLQVLLFQGQRFQCFSHPALSSSQSVNQQHQWSLLPPLIHHALPLEHLSLHSLHAANPNCKRL